MARSKSKRIKSDLGRWFAEEWIDVCQLPKIVKCGRDKAKWKDYPYCRPLKRINKSTPKTAGELSKTEIKKRCSKKKKNPRKRLLPKSKRRKSIRRKLPKSKSKRRKSIPKKLPKSKRRKSIRRKLPKSKRRKSIRRKLPKGKSKRRKNTS